MHKGPKSKALNSPAKKKLSILGSCLWHENPVIFCSSCGKYHFIFQAEDAMCVILRNFGNQEKLDLWTLKAMPLLSTKAKKRLSRLFTQ